MSKTKLSIYYDYGNWYASASNLPKPYKFAGKNAEDQIVQVGALQQAMTEGQVAVVERASRFFTEAVENRIAPGALVEELFGSTQELWYENHCIFEAKPSLLDEIREAGKAWWHYRPL